VSFNKDHGAHTLNILSKYFKFVSYFLKDFLDSGPRGSAFIQQF